jgi:hypothetical protein
MPFSGMFRHVALVRTDVLEERITSIIRMTRIGELGTALAITAASACYPDDGGVIFLQNIGSYKSHMVKYPRRWHSS